jgi:alkylhydroperoxidase family enzyme
MFHVTRIPPDDSIQLPSFESASFATMEMLFRTMGQRPNIMQAAMQFLEVVMRQGTVEPQLKELLAIRVSQVNHCFY